MEPQKRNEMVASAIAQAAQLGSTATTLRGAIKYLRSHRQSASLPGLHYITLRKRCLRNPEQSKCYAVACYRQTNWTARRDWLARSDDRKSKPDAKRARDDKQFRRQYLRQLRAEEKRLVRETNTLSGITSSWDRLSQTRVSLKSVADSREIACGKRNQVKYTPQQQYHLISVNSRTARLAGCAINMTGKDAIIKPVVRSSYGYHSPGETEWKNGRPVSYTRATHENYVRSFAIFGDNPQTICYALHGTEYTITLPDGYAWRADMYGLCAYITSSQGDDFHVDAYYLLKGAADIVKRLESNRQRRIQIETKYWAEIADMDGVWVGVDDSIRAGNCRVGTQIFATKHGLDINRHYPALEVFRLGSLDVMFGLVRLAITAATLRHKHEMECGYCKI